QRDLSGMNIARGSEAEPALNRRAEISQNVAEEIVTDDHVVLRRIEHHVHRHRVDVLVIRGNLRITSRNFLENTLPQIASETLHVRLVSHRHALAAVRTRVLECSDDDPFDSATRVDFVLERDLVGSSMLQKTTGSDVRAFSVFAKDDEIYVSSFAVEQRRESIVEHAQG